LVTLHGRRAYDKRRVETLIATQRVQALSLAETGSFAGQEIEIKSNSGLAVKVNPLNGSMAGLLYAAKNADKMESKFLDFVGGKKTKRRWCELDEAGFKWCAGHDKEEDYRGVVPLSGILEVRPYTMDTNVSAETQHCFEFDTQERAYALGCETAEEKDHWVTALQRARDNFLMTQASYRAQHRELRVEDVSKFAQQFRKHVAVYVSIAEEDERVRAATAGVDLSSLDEVARYLTLEATAAGSGGALLGLLQDLLLVPAGQQHAVFSAAGQASQQLRLRAKRALPVVGDHAAAAVADAVAAGGSIIESLRDKVDEGGAQYAQLNKLALRLMQTEAQVAELGAQLRSVRQLQERSTEHQTTSWKALKNLSSADIDELLAASGRSAVTDEHWARAEKLRDASVEAQQRMFDLASGTARAGSQLGKPSASRRQLAALVAMKKAAQGASAAAGDVAAETAASTGGDGAADEAPAAPPTAAPSASPAPPPPSAAAAVVDERFARFEKMRKVLPEAAVRQKMSLEGFSEAEVEGFFSGAVAATAAAPSPAATPARAAPPTQSAVGAGASLAAVAAAAKKKQEEEDARPPPGMAPKAAVKPQTKLKGLFWQKMKNAELGGTLWHLLDEPELSEAERRLLEDCFAAKQASAPVAAAALSTAAATASAAADKQVSLLDGKRTQNVLILLGKLRKTPEELTQLVVALDPAQLDHELTRTLLEVLPSAEGERAPSSPVRRSSLTRVLMRRIRRGAGVRRARAAGRGVSVRAAVSPGAAAAGAAGVPRSRLQLAGRLPGRRGAAGRRPSRVR
jgi:hypothetical protein